jgi:hypothetical protein
VPGWINVLMYNDLSNILCNRACCEFLKHCFTQRSTSLRLDAMLKKLIYIVVAKRSEELDFFNMPKSFRLWSLCCGKKVVEKNFV